MTQTPAIDYTNKDYTALRQAMLELARYRLPEWTDHSPSDLGVLLVDLFAYMGDIVLYYQDRIANESFLHTAVERRSVMHLLRLIGYELRPPVSAGAELVMTFKVPVPGSTVVTIPTGAEFRSTVPKATPQTFAYLGPSLTIDLASDQVQPAASGQVSCPLPVWHCRMVGTEVIGSSTGEPNQSFLLSQSPLIRDTLKVEVQEGAGWVAWEQRESLLYQMGTEGRVRISSPDARDYTVQYDQDGKAYVIFGDGLYGRRPPSGANNIRATYRVGGGAVGNVPAGAISEVLTSIPHLVAVTNPKAAGGGEDAESAEHGVSFGPLAFRSGQRAVTLSDYEGLAHKAGGVAKVRARAVGWNDIELYVAPQGRCCQSLPEGLRRRLTAFFEEKRMAGTFVHILDAPAVPIDVTVEVTGDARYSEQSVRQGALDAIGALLAFENVDFGQSIYQSDLYAALDPVPGILDVALRRFRRQDAPAISIEERLQELNLPPFGQLPEFLQQAVLTQMTTEGRVELDDHEIPMAGTIEVVVKVASR